MFPSVCFRPLARVTTVVVLLLGFTSSSQSATVVYPVRAHRPVGERHSSPANPESARMLDELSARLRLPMQATNTGAQSDHSATSVLAKTVVIDEMQAMPPAISFDGVDWTGWNPGSPDIAAGPNHLLLATTDRFSVMDKVGNTLDTDLFQTRFNLPAEFPYYFPKVLYDTFTPRWLMVYTTTNATQTIGFVYLAVSETADPLGDWFYYSFPSSPELPGIRDDVAVAVTPNEIYLTWNRFNAGTFNFEGSVIVELVKAQVYAGGPVTIYSRTAMTNPNDGSLASTVKPAQMKTYAGEMVFVNNASFGDDYFTLWKLTGPPGASVLTGFNVAVPPYAFPMDMVQPGAARVEAGDCRIRDAVYRSGALYAAYTRNEGVSLGPTIEILKIDVATATLRDAVATASSQVDFAYPAIDINQNNQITLGFCQSGAAMFLSFRYAVFSMDPLVPLDAGDVMLGLASFVHGLVPYRWGPYFGVALDPANDRRAWVHGLYASDSPVNTWTSRVGGIAMNPTPVTGGLRSPMMITATTPNPAGAMVRFDYSVDEAGEIEIAVYDVAGKRVDTVINKYVETPGTDAAEFDTSKLASGVYFVKLSTPTKSASRKFVVTH